LESKNHNITNQNSWIKPLRNVFFLFIIGGMFLIVYLFYLSTNLPSIDELNKYNPEQVSKIISSDDIIIKKLYVRKRDMIDISNIPQHLIDALIVMEDRDFYIHNGINIKSTFRALIVDILSFSSKQGASTLTQQLARTMYNNDKAKYYIGQSKKINRKVKELITAIKIEQTYTKSEILELYLNSVYFGHGTYGVQAASLYYFGKDVSNISLDESAILIGLLPAPARYSPIKHPDRAIRKRNLVLKVMADNNFLDKDEFDIAMSTLLPIKKTDYDNSLAPYFSEYIRRELEQVDDELNINIYQDGLNIHTTLDMGIQRIVEDSFNEVMMKNQTIFNKNILNSNNKLKSLSNDLKISIDSLKSILSDSTMIPVEFRKKLLVQGAVVVLDPTSGHILSMIGGRNEPEYVDHFNRATQAKRQPGSVFKPLIYLTALEQGYSACTQLMNQPLVFFIDDTTRWNPQNHDGSTSLLESLRDGLRKSLNLISVRIVQELVTPKDVKNTSVRFGLSTDIRAVDAIALGVSEVIPLEITTAYSAIANNGILNTPLSIISISDNEEREIKQFMNESIEVANENDIYILRDMMKSVIDRGTGGKIRWKYNFLAPAAGKTGTTNSKTDAWFVGFTPQLTIGVWVGVDDPSMVLGDKQYGSSAALPIFAKSIKSIYDKGHYNYLNQKVKLNSRIDWEMPNNVIVKDICNNTCCLKTEWCDSYKEYFNIDRLELDPLETCSDNNPLFRFTD
jgi:penicillin-binding protein 1A